MRHDHNKLVLKVLSLVDQGASDEEIQDVISAAGESSVDVDNVDSVRTLSYADPYSYYQQPAAAYGYGPAYYY